MDRPEPSPVQRFFGALLMAVGGLIATLCGACTAVVLVAGLANLKDSQGYGSMMLIMSLVIGGVPTLIGVGLFAWGRWLRKTEDRPTLPQANFDRLD